MLKKPALTANKAFYHTRFMTFAYLNDKIFQTGFILHYLYSFIALLKKFVYCLYFFMLHFTVYYFEFFWSPCQ